MKKVLIVDDEQEVAILIQETLLDQGFDAHAVFSSLEALELLKTNNYHLVITDVIMPGLNGIELTEHVFNNYPDTKVLACSGGGNSGKLVAGMALDQALEEGADNALLKPFTQEELVVKVKNLI